MIRRPCGIGRNIVQPRRDGERADLRQAAEEGLARERDHAALIGEGDIEMAAIRA